MRSVHSSLPIRLLFMQLSLRSVSICILLIGLSSAAVRAQQPPNNPQAQNFQRAAIAPPGAQQNPLFAGPNVGPNANLGANGRPRGAAANADFDSLIDLIESTVANDTWSQNGGGQADIRPFPGGVLVDAAGVLRLRSRASNNHSDAAKDLARDLAALRGTAPPVVAQSGKSSRASRLRYVSLPRLEREIVRRQAAHQRLDPAMLTLAGLQRVRYIFAYPETGDVVLAGPAGDWFVDKDGHILSADSHEPVVRLDDLLTIWRRGAEAADSHFGCSINPRQESLAKTQAFLAASSKKPLEPSHRKQWLSDLRDCVGRQDIDIFGIDPTSRVASVLVEADYHMKLIGMGLADGVDGVESYLQSIHLRSGESPPPMSVLRWWFALKYDAIAHSETRDAFELVGQGVRVLSENELLAEQGQRVHTGASDPLNRQFAQSFTSHFDALAKKYPVYGELRNIFDLAMAVALIQTEDLPERVHWKPTLLASGDKLRLPHRRPPREVETVINHRVINQRFVIAGVSGGVMVAPGDVLRATKAMDSTDKTIQRAAPGPKELAAGAWWWDAQ
ncbi:MAG TPA: DUF1598 domain-containing protein [Lacipirellulaceae bacterium]|nr:DUF1598 domain-containing protein [Lacipirellulaceae bacterium]